jgi:single-stranded-DNA-specific exonuclease
MKAKRWIVRGQNIESAASLARVLGVSPILAELLSTRGGDHERAARAFLAPSYEQLHDPYLMLGMEKAVVRLQAAIDNDEPVLIYATTTSTEQPVRRFCCER